MPTPIARIPYSGAKLVGVSPGTETGDVVVFEQIFGAFLPLSGGTLTGVLALVAGTALLPGAAFAGDLTSGIFLEAAGTLGLTAGASQKMRLDTNGVGFVNAVNTAAAQAGTLTNSPVAGDPTFWIQVSVNGVVKSIPAW